MHDGLNAIKAALQKYTVSGVFSGVLLRPVEWVSKLVYSRLQSIDKFVLSNRYKALCQRFLVVLPGRFFKLLTGASLVQSGVSTGT